MKGEHSVDNSLIERLQRMIDGSGRIVFFGGAGVSTESGIPDFRSQDGLYNQKYDYPPEEIISRSFFQAHPDIFYKFYRDKLDCRGAQPNAAHIYLAQLERAGKLAAVITQNIDGLHQAAGSENVLELHGTLLRNYCSRCGKSYDRDYCFTGGDIPRCSCGGVVRPDIVLYEESLDESVLLRSIEELRAADMLIVGGTSLVVYPAAGLINYYSGSRLVLINKTSTPYDSAANLVINDSIGEVFSRLYV